eukprot:782127_1
MILTSRRSTITPSNTAWRFRRMFMVESSRCRTATANRSTSSPANRSTSCRTARSATAGTGSMSTATRDSSTTASTRTASAHRGKIWLSTSHHITPTTTRRSTAASSRLECIFRTMHVTMTCTSVMATVMVQTNTVRNTANHTRILIQNSCGTIMTVITPLPMTAITPLAMTTITPLDMTTITPLAMTTITPLAMTTITPLAMTTITPLAMTTITSPGYDNHHFTGYDNHHSTGHDDHHPTGYDNHHSPGYGNHHFTGNHHSTGNDDHHSTGYDNHPSTGYDDHHSTGYGDHHPTGYDDHHSTGYDSHHSPGYDSHHFHGYDNHHSTWYDDHHSTGYGDHHPTGYGGHHSTGYDKHHSSGYGHNVHGGYDNHGHHGGYDAHHASGYGGYGGDHNQDHGHDSTHKPIYTGYPFTADYNNKTTGYDNGKSHGDSQKKSDHGHNDKHQVGYGGHHHGGYGNSHHGGYGGDHHNGGYGGDHHHGGYGGDHHHGGYGGDHHHGGYGGDHHHGDYDCVPVTPLEIWRSFPWSVSVAVSVHSKLRDVRVYDTAKVLVYQSSEHVCVNEFQWYPNHEPNVNVEASLTFTTKVKQPLYMKLVDFEVVNFKGRADVCELHGESSCGDHYGSGHGSGYEPCRQEFLAVLLPDHGACYIDATIKLKFEYRCADPYDHSHHNECEKYHSGENAIWAEIDYKSESWCDSYDHEIHPPPARLSAYTCENCYDEYNRKCETWDFYKDEISFYEAQVDSNHYLPIHKTEIKDLHLVAYCHGYSKPHYQGMADGSWWLMKNGHISPDGRRFHLKVDNDPEKLCGYGHAETAARFSYKFDPHYFHFPAHGGDCKFDIWVTLALHYKGVGYDHTKLLEISSPADGAAMSSDGNTFKQGTIQGGGNVYHGHRPKNSY